MQNLDAELRASNRNGQGDGKAMKIEDLQANARRASALLKAMCNERRLLILCHLSQGGLS